MQEYEDACSAVHAKAGTTMPDTTPHTGMGKQEGNAQCMGQGMGTGSLSSTPCVVWGGPCVWARGPAVKRERHA